MWCETLHRLEEKSSLICRKRICKPSQW
jgi:hypothetical protein